LQSSLVARKRLQIAGLLQALCLLRFVETVCNGIEGQSYDGVQIEGLSQEILKALGNAFLNGNWLATRLNLFYCGASLLQTGSLLLHAFQLISFHRALDQPNCLRHQILSERISGKFSFPRVSQFPKPMLTAS
jgi:hypothetical protein